MADNKNQTVFRRELPLIAERKIGGGTVVGVILRDDRVEIMAGHVPGGAQAKRILIPCVLVLGIDSGRVIGPAEKGELAMESGISALESIDLNHAAHLPAEFCRNAGGVNVDGFHVIGFGG